MNVKGGLLNFETDRYTSREEFDAFNRRLPLANGDVLLTIVGTIGRSAVVADVSPLVFQRSVAVIRPKATRLSSRFLYHVTQSAGFQTQLDRAANKSSQAGVYLGKLGDVEIPLPPLPEQRRIAAILDQADALRAKRREALAQLDSLTQSIFIEMFGDPSSNPMNWEVVNLESIATKITDGEHLTPRRTNAGIKLLSARNVRDGFLAFDDVDYIDDIEYRRISKRCNPELDDILISCSGSIGRVALVETTEPLALVRSAALVKPDRRKIGSKFLETYLRSAHLNRLMVKSAHSSSQANLFQGPIRSLPVYLPRLELQGSFEKRHQAVRKIRNSHAAAANDLDALFASLQHRAFAGML